jgi:hypothetical protein
MNISQTNDIITILCTNNCKHGCSITILDTPELKYIDEKYILTIVYDNLWIILSYGQHRHVLAFCSIRCIAEWSLAKLKDSESFEINAQMGNNIQN